jgi:hypothetical protein
VVVGGLVVLVMTLLDCLLKTPRQENPTAPRDRQRTTIKETT